MKELLEELYTLKILSYEVYIECKKWIDNGMLFDELPDNIRVKKILIEILKTVNNDKIIKENSDYFIASDLVIFPTREERDLYESYLLKEKIKKIEHR